MASSDNLIASTFENSWGFRSTFDNSWISQAYARDTQILTKALQQSISNHNNNNNDFVKHETTSSHHQTQSFTSSGGGSETDTVSKGSTFRNGPIGGRITKRKSRASKRSATTFIVADPDNFRQMVQQVTGIQFSGGPGQVGSVLKPEPERVVNRVQVGCVLPTLDTSAFLLDNQEGQKEEVVGLGPGFVEFGPNHVGGSDFDEFAGFPTLESWN